MLETLTRGYEKVLLDLTFTKNGGSNTAKFSCFTMKESSDCVTCTRFPRQIVLVEDKPTSA